MLMKCRREWEKVVVVSQWSRCKECCPNYQASRDPASELPRYLRQGSASRLEANKECLRSEL